MSDNIKDLLAALGGGLASILLTIWILKQVYKEE